MQVTFGQATCMIVTCRRLLLAACHAPSSGVRRGTLTLIGLECILADSLNTPMITTLQPCVQLHLGHLICTEGRIHAGGLFAKPLKP